MWLIESPVSKQRLHEMFRAIDGLLRENMEVGSYNQLIDNAELNK